jgi:hypothetical protein
MLCSAQSIEATLRTACERLRFEPLRRGGATRDPRLIVLDCQNAAQDTKATKL